MPSSASRTPKSTWPSKPVDDQLDEFIFRSPSPSDTRSRRTNLFPYPAENTASDLMDDLWLPGHSSVPGSTLHEELRLEEFAGPVPSSELQLQRDFLREEREDPLLTADSPHTFSRSTSPAFFPCVDGPSETHATGAVSHSIRNEDGGTQDHKKNLYPGQLFYSQTPTTPLGHQINPATKGTQGKEYQPPPATAIASLPAPPHQPEQRSLNLDTASAFNQEVSSNSKFAQPGATETGAATAPQHPNTSLTSEEGADIEVAAAASGSAEIAVSMLEPYHQTQSRVRAHKRTETSPPHDTIGVDKDNEAGVSLNAPGRSKKCTVPDGSSQPLDRRSEGPGAPHKPGEPDTPVRSQEPEDTTAQQEPKATSVADGLTQPRSLTRQHPQSRSHHDRSKASQPCVHCFMAYAKGKEVDCDGPATHTLERKMACPLCARQKKSCQAFPESVIEDVKAFWYDKPKFDFEQRKELKNIKQKMLLSEPVTRRQAEEEKCKELFLVASRALGAVADLREVGEFVKAARPSPE